MTAVLSPLETRLLPWMSWGLCIFVSAFLWAPSRDGLEGIYALALFIPSVVLIARHPSRLTELGVFTPLALLFATWSWVSGWWGGDVGYLTLQWVIIASWLFASQWVIARKALDQTRFLNGLLIIGSVSALVITVYFYLNHPFSDRLEGITAARAATLVGHVYGVVALIAVYLSWQSKTLLNSVLLTLAAVPALAAVVLSQSRGPAIAIVLSLFVGMIWLRPAWRVIGVQLILGIMGIAALFSAISFDELALGRGASFRDEIWLLVWERIIQSPLHLLIGNGLSESTDIASPTMVFHHAHNAWLDIWHHSGLIGLTLIAAHLVLLLWVGFQHKSVAVFVLWLIYGVVCLSVDSRTLFWEIDTKWWLYWVPAGLLAAQLMRVAVKRPTEETFL